MIIQRFQCPECGEFNMTIKQLNSTNACGRCEISDLPGEKPQSLTCWNKRCKRKFAGTMADHPKYTLCPKCKELSIGMISLHNGRTYHDHKRVGSARDAYPGEIIVCL